MFGGAITALVTPFRDDSKNIDEEAFCAMIDRQLRHGINGMVPCGTTGESATLTFSEHERIIDITVSETAGRVPVIAGTGSNNTAEAVHFTIHAKKAGADAALLICPYYNKPSQEGLYLHFKRVAEEAKFPIIVYNLPGRTGVNLLPDTVYRLSRIPDIVGIKEATGDMKQVSEIIEKCGESFTVLSGDDFTTLPLLALGGHGAISVVSNIEVESTVEMIEAFKKGDIKRAQALHLKLMPLTRALFLETNPVPVKTALSALGFMSADTRLPLCSMTEQNNRELTAVLDQYRQR